MLAAACLAVLVSAAAGFLWLTRADAPEARAWLLGSAYRALNVFGERAGTDEVAEVATVGAALAVTLGPATGDVTATSAVVWARASRPAEMHVEYAAERLEDWRAAGPALALSDTDFAAVVGLRALQPDTGYRYRVWFSGGGGDGAERSEPRGGSFRTAPSAASSRAVSFVVGGDLGGAGRCRSVADGYSIFRPMEALQPHFFVAAGDMIYADNECPAAGPDGRRNVPGRFLGVDNLRVDWTDVGQLREVYLAHWRYNRADTSFQRFLQQTPMYSQWDDHEVINDSGASWTYWNATSAHRAGYPNLVQAAREAFFSYAPVDRQPSDPDRIFRSFSWGSELDLFLLDVRSYRDRNDRADTLENHKTMLGPEQLDWLKDALGASRATWKVVSGGVPLSVPTGGMAAPVYGRDGWANGSAPDYSAQTGFERELLGLVRFLDERRITNVVFVAADLHRPLAIRYEIDADGDGLPLVFHELVAGPLSDSAPAGLPPQLDQTLNPTLLYAESGFFNFGYVRIEPAPGVGSRLVADVRGEDGSPRPGSEVVLRAEPGR